MKRLFSKYRSAGKELYLVGGAVRDLLRGVPYAALDDLDFASNATPDESLAILRGAQLVTHDVGKHFGTVGCLLAGDPSEGYPKDCQITTYRCRETYAQGSRHPIVKFGKTIDEDLWRRDFSINSIAMDADGELVDPYDGRSDLDKGVLRAVGSASCRMAEDPLRMLRIGRFISTLGFGADEALTAAATNHAETLLQISHERWLHELNKLLMGAFSSKGLNFLFDTTLLHHILPEVAALRGFHESSAVHHKDLWEHTLTVVERAERDVVQVWSALIHDVGKLWCRTVDQGKVHFLGHEAKSAELFAGLATRFRFDNKRTHEIGGVIRHHGRAAAYDPQWSDAAVRRFVRLTSPQTDALLRFAGADLTTRVPARRKAATDRLADLRRRIRVMAEAEELTPVLPRHLGQDVMKALKLRPGPAVGRAIRSVRDACEEGHLAMAPTTADCLHFLVAQRVAQPPGD